MEGRAGRWIAASGLLLLAACRSGGTRGPSLTAEMTSAPPGVAGWRAEASSRHAQGGTVAEQAVMARLWASTRALVEADLAAGRLAEGRSPSREVQDYAAKLVEEDATDLRALADAARAKALDVDAPAVQREPALAATRAASEEELARLGALRGEAFEAAYLTAEPAVLARLAALGEQGERVASDVDLGNVLRMIAHQASERAGRVEAMSREARVGRGVGAPTPAGRP